MIEKFVEGLIFGFGFTLAGLLMASVYFLLMDSIEHYFNAHKKAIQRKFDNEDGYG